MTDDIFRRDFLALVSAAGFGALVSSTTTAWGLEQVTNPLASYPDRGWERVYRDLWNYDSRYTFACAPNDTHNCLLRAYVRQGVITRITRDEVGRHSTVQNPRLEGAVEVTLADGSRVRCRPTFDLVKEYAAHFTPQVVEELTWAPAAAVEALARHVAAQPGTTLFALGMGPNQFFNSDNKDRDVLLLGALTGNLGRVGGNVGSYAGNHRVSLFNGAPQYRTSRSARRVRNSARTMAVAPQTCAPSTSK
jgi:anaerobic selenocysteine-containing dehydrogenase